MELPNWSAIYWGTSDYGTQRKDIQNPGWPMAVYILSTTKLVADNIRA
jgi:hypothetical protein